MFLNRILQFEPLVREFRLENVHLGEDIWKFFVGHNIHVTEINLYLSTAK